MVCSAITTAISNRRGAAEVFVQSVHKSLEGNTNSTDCDTAGHANDCCGTRTGVDPTASDTLEMTFLPDTCSHINETVMVTIVEWDNVPLSALTVSV